ncbi:hypothetical protein [Microbulbifer aestuariivivens]|uniref:hypothetical protein n=1 Tax=Microbulbifer aestuariivivens TaxID=1908308 RepID=UPI0031ED9223
MVNRLLGGVPVTLSREALTNSSILVVERAEPRNLQQRPLAGRSLEAPLRFQLLEGAGGCWLRLLPQGPVQRLNEARCVREEAQGQQAGG